MRNLGRGFVAGVTLVGALALLLCTGFIDGGSDYVQYLLPAYQARDPAFAQNDWFVHQTTAYHLAYGWLTSLALRHDLLRPMLLGWHLATLTLLSWVTLSWLHFFARIDGAVMQHGAVTWLRARVVAAFALVLLLIVAGFGTMWGERVPVGPHALPAFAAIPLVLGLWLATLDRRFIAGGAWFAALAVVHAHAAAIAACAAVPLLLFGRARVVLGDRRAWIGLAIALAGLAPLLLLYASPSAAPVDAPVPDQIFKVLFYGRAPHHFAPHLAAPSVHVASSAALLSCLLAVAWAPIAAGARGALARWWLVLAVMFASSVIFLVVVYWPPAVFAFPLRVLPAMLIVGSALLAWTAVSGQRYAVAAALTLAAGLTHPHSAAVGLALLALACVHAALTRVAAVGIHRARVTVAVAAVILVAAAADATVRAVHDAPPLMRSWPNRQTAQLFAALARHTPPGSVIAVPPDLSGVQIGANRAVVVDFKCAPVLRGAELEAWRQRMRALTGLDPLTLDHRREPTVLERYRRAYGARSGPELANDLARYGATHVVAQTGTSLAASLQQMGAPLLWRSKRYVLHETGKHGYPLGEP